MSFKYKDLTLAEELADLLREPAQHIEPKVDVEACGEALIVNLNAQLELYTAYVAHAGRQRLALVNRNLAENIAANVETERLIGALYGLEKERILVTEKILGSGKGGEAGKGAAQVKCEVIYPLLSPARAERLKITRDALVKVTGELKNILGINAALVENGSRMIHTTIGIITSVVGRKQNEKMNTYTAKGSVRMGKMQIRNLINRSV